MTFDDRGGAGSHGPYGGPDRPHVSGAARRTRGAERARSRPPRRGPTRPPGRRRRRRAGRVTVLLLAVIVVVVVVAAAWYAVSYFSTGKPGQLVRVDIPAGSSLSDIGRVLERAGVVKHADAFVIKAESDGYANDLQAGVYRLRVNEPYGSLVAALRAGPPDNGVKVTIPEGFTARQIAALVAGKVPGFSAEQYIDLTLVHPLPFKVEGFTSGGSLEGFLFPATYDIAPGTSPRAFIRQQLRVFRRTMATIDLGRARSKNLTTYDVVTIGSMVEREIKVPAERPLGAAVIWNRLHLRMALQIDATIEYALPVYKPQLSLQDLKLKSPYNTYLHAGLPPTPIANPGAAALRAAAHPAAVGYLYYVARNDGSGRHYFSSSYAQFLKDKARAQQ
ncbi:MAG TPA: endolytic transglycosylase MltG [Thermoleophilia bacterium]|nr:endolytic transglycosylase MltG [Thermoleophilia bacterium]